MLYKQMILFQETRTQLFLLSKMSRAEVIKRELKKSKGANSFSLKNLFGSVNTLLRLFIQPSLKASELLFPSEQG